MKRILLFTILLISFGGFAQSYDFTLIQNSNYNYTVAAVSNFDSNSNTPNLESFSFTIMLPVGATINESTINFGYLSLSNIGFFTADQIDAFDPGEDRSASVVTSNTGSAAFVASPAGTSFDLVTFDIEGNPISENITLLSNSHPLAVASGGAFNSFINIDIAGGTAVVDEYSGQTGTTSYTFTDPTLSNNSFTKSNFSLTPNPNNGQFAITSTAPLENATLSIFNITGQEVYRTSMNTFGRTTFDVNLSRQLTAGAYLLKIDNGNASKILKFLVN